MLNLAQKLIVSTPTKLCKTHLPSSKPAFAKNASIISLKSLFQSVRVHQQQKFK